MSSVASAKEDLVLRSFGEGGSLFVPYVFFVAKNIPIHSTRSTRSTLQKSLLPVLSSLFPITGSPEEFTAKRRAIICRI